MSLKSSTRCSAPVSYTHLDVYKRQLHRLFADSYTGACELYELCVPSMDAMLAAMRSAPGFIAGRQAGAGFGGCLVALVEGAQTDAFVSHVGPHYQQATGVTPAIYAVSPTDGASVLDW